MFTSINIKTKLKFIKYNPLWRLRIIRLCSLMAAILFFGVPPTYGDVDLADFPLFTQINPPPTNLMILQDDSGSMTYEILVRGAYDGQFPNPDSTATQGYCYVFDNMGDGYNYTNEWRHLGKEGRKYWRSQWHEYNVIYYNPHAVYEPWPGYEGKTFSDADTEAPLVHPLQGITLDLDAESFSVKLVDDAKGRAIKTLEVPWAHYFAKSIDGNVYLVIMDNAAGENKYYIVTTDGADEPLDKVKSVKLAADPPVDLDRDYDLDRQNFANWFTYHRRREFEAKAAIAHVLADADFDDLRMGVLGINNKIIIPLKPVRAVIGGKFEDKSDEIMEEMYQYVSRGGTPLKGGLQKIGEYFRVNDGDLQGEKGDPPYPADGGACQQSFTIVVTDGYYSDNGHTFEGNTDGNESEPYGDWGGGKAPYSDKYKDTLADIAMYYYANDLNQKLDNFLPTNKFDQAEHQHMVTFAVAFGVSGTLNHNDYEDDRTNPNYMRYITKKDPPREYGDYVVWPYVSGARQPESIDDLWHATVNSRGVFVNAGEPEKLVEGLREIIKDIKGREPTSVASVSTNGDQFYVEMGPDLFILQSSYSYIDYLWFGDVKAYAVDQVTGEVADPKWSAADELLNTPWQTRHILTFDGEKSGQLFVYNDLTEDQKMDLGNDAEDTLEFIRGKDPDSGGNRINMLGDIVHSSPVFFDDVVYFGANDGMLHAVNAEDGKEVFAYVPHLVFKKLKKLADPDYTHEFYVDATPTVQKGKDLLKAGGEQTILVSGLGKGGQGIFALDVTKPDRDNMTKDKVLWEFGNTHIQKDEDDDEGAEVNEDDMGYSFSKPVVVKSYSEAYPWIVIFGNGYNSKNGQSVLFILDAKTGKLIKKLPAGSGPDNGLSSPIAVHIDFDDVVDFVYAGDLEGNLWKFDLVSENPLDWDVAFQDGTKPIALFSATDPSGNPQSITTRPDVMFHPEKHGLMVCFGTGRLLADSDLARTQTQTLYGIWDYGDTVFEAPDGWSPDDDDEYVGRFESRNRAERMVSNPDLSKNVKLREQIATDFEVTSGETTVGVRILTANKPVWDTKPDPDGNGQFPDPTDSDNNDVGWYLDLDVSAGERVISDVILRDGILIAIGFIPSQTRCKSGGESIFMELDAFTGGTIGAIQFDLNDDGIVDDDDLIEVEIDGKLVKLPPSGKKLAGLVQSPAIVQLTETSEMKYLSSSSGGIVNIAERRAKTGIAYWMEVYPD
jgi:type IV pilus assembly protein PilY1